MEVKEVMQCRRSVRKFTQEPVPEEKILQLLHAAMSGPSACNHTPWDFWVVTNPETLNALRTTTRFTGYEAPLVIAVAGNLSRALPIMPDFWVQDCSAATENILLQATDLGLGAVWCGVYPDKETIARVSQILGLAPDVVPLNLICIGYPVETPEPRDQYTDDFVHWVK